MSVADEHVDRTALAIPSAMYYCVWVYRAFSSIVLLVFLLSLSRQLTAPV